MKKIKLLFLMLLIMILATGCYPELYHDYEENGDPVSISTDDNRWFGYNQGIRIVTKGEDVLLDFEIKENDDGTTTVILQIGEENK